MTQSLAYKGIRQTKLQSNVTQRRSTAQRINQFKIEVEDQQGRTQMKTKSGKQSTIKTSQGRHTTSYG